VVKEFIDNVKNKALGEIVHNQVTHGGKKLKVSPEQHFVKICYDELVGIMGPVDTSLKLTGRAVSAVMMVGLQGSGKTPQRQSSRDSSRKWGKSHAGCGRVYRPAAIDQLKVLGGRLDVPVFFAPGKTPPQICKDAMEAAQFKGCDVVLFDTAGRTIVDDTLMQELEDIKSLTKPENILLVVDAMIGQESVNVAREFDRRLDLSGFILTKLDGDARGGAALSIKEVTKKPVKYLGMGESLDKLEEFRPEGLASRILGHGDIVGLVKDFEEVIDEKKAEEDAAKLLSGEFYFDDFLKQLKMMKKMGSLTDIIGKLPLGQFGLPQGFQVDDKEIVRVEAVIHSMTPFERANPDCLNDSRINRIAKGSGQPRQRITELIARFNTMKQIMQGLGMGKKKVLSKLGVNPNIAGVLERGAPKQPKKVLVDLKKRKDKKKASKKAKKRNR
jgi:signal recognition particle subunit SRP54